MILNLGPQHPATHGTLRLVVRLDGERVLAADPVIGYMHRGYEKLTEFRTYPQITTLINRIDWLSSFANEVPFIDAAEKLMGIEAPPRADLHPHDPHRAVAHRDVPPVPRRDGSAGRRAHAGVLRVPRPRARAQPDRGRDRWPVPPELQPHRRHQGRPAVGLDRRDPHRDEDRARRLRRRSRTSCSATRSSRPAPARSASSPASSARRTACRARTSGRRASTGTCAATAARTSRTPSSTSRSGRTPTATRTRAYWVRLQETRESALMVLQMLDQHARAGRSWRRSRGSSRCPRARSGSRPRTRSARWATTSSRRARPARSASRSAPRRSATSRSCRGCCAACTSPTSSRSSRSLYFILGDIDR